MIWKPRPAGFDILPADWRWFRLIADLSGTTGFQAFTPVRIS
jgi:hypothetical protein